MPASLLASMMPWRQILRSCADAPPASAAVTASIAENRTTLGHLQRVMLALLWLSLFPILAERHLTTLRMPVQSPISAQSEPGSISRWVDTLGAAIARLDRAIQ